MRTEERQIQMYELIKSNGEIMVSTLSEYFDVSTMTIRRDLDALEHSGQIRRQYGKAIIVDKGQKDMKFILRHETNTLLKHQIALSAIRHLKNVSSIYIDGSSTAYEFIQALPPERHLTVFTNSAVVLQYLRERANITTFIIGGFLSKDNTTLDSEITVNIAKTIFVDAAIISCSGFSVEGVFNNGIIGSQVKRIMLENSGHNYLLADHTKFNMKGIFLQNNWNKINTFICDRHFDAKTEKALERMGIELVFYNGALVK